jgi:hypothetical protein
MRVCDGRALAKGATCLAVRRNCEPAGSAADVDDADDDDLEEDDDDDAGEFRLAACLADRPVPVPLPPPGRKGTPTKGENED